MRESADLQIAGARPGATARSARGWWTREPILSIRLTTGSSRPR